MDYKVIPFTATLDKKKETAGVIASQLQSLIASHATDGWSFVRLESVSTFVQPDPGCFGIGAKQGYMSAFQMAVFQKG